MSDALKYVWSITVKVEAMNDGEPQGHVAVSTHHTSPIATAPTDEDRAELQLIEETAWRGILTMLERQPV